MFICMRAQAKALRELRHVNTGAVTLDPLPTAIQIAFRLSHSDQWARTTPQYRRNSEPRGDRAPEKIAIESLPLIQKGEHLSAANVTIDIPFSQMQSS